MPQGTEMCLMDERVLGFEECEYTCQAEEQEYALNWGTGVCLRDKSVCLRGRGVPTGQAWRIGVHLIGP